MGERVDTESVFELMRSYFDAARAALERHGGTVEKFIGDAVVGMFGVPEAHEDDALRACRAALEIQQRVAEPRMTGIAVRIGVNTGEVVAGDAARREMFASVTRVLGDAVNVAARLEQAAAPGEVLLGEATYRLVARRGRGRAGASRSRRRGSRSRWSPTGCSRRARTGRCPRRAWSALVGRGDGARAARGEFEQVGLGASLPAGHGRRRGGVGQVAARRRS